MKLTFEALRLANQARLPHFKTPDGSPSTHGPDGRGWSLGDWACAFVGEAGELCNVIKKIFRGDFDRIVNVYSGDLKNKLKEEIGGTLTYLDMLAGQCGLTLEECIQYEWNRVAEKQGLDMRIEHFN